MNIELPQPTNGSACDASNIDRIMRREKIIGEALKMAIHSHAWGTTFDLEQAEYAYAVYMGFVDA